MTDSKSNREGIFPQLQQEFLSSSNMQFHYGAPGWNAGLYLHVMGVWMTKHKNTSMWLFVPVQPRKGWVKVIKTSKTWTVISIKITTQEKRNAALGIWHFHGYLYYDSPIQRKFDPEVCQSNANLQEYHTPSHFTFSGGNISQWKARSAVKIWKWGQSNLPCYEY